MKKIVLAIFLLLATQYLMAQSNIPLPNGGFEVWQAKMGAGIPPINYEEPLQWTTSDTIGAITGDAKNVNVIKVSSPKKSGNYAIKLSTIKMQTGIPGFPDTLSGILASSNSIFNALASQPKGGFPFSAKAKSFKGFYAYQHGFARPDSAAIFVLLKSKGQTVGAATTLLGNSPTANLLYPFSMDFYIADSTAQVDSVFIVLTSSNYDNDKFAGAINSQLVLDDLSITTSSDNTNSMYNPAAVLDVRMFPNPAYNDISFENKSAEDVSVLLISSTGAKVLGFSLKAQEKQKHNIEHLAAGNYIYLVKNKHNKLVNGNTLVIVK